VPDAAKTPTPRTRKPSRWDRPKPPRDWRWWVGGTGRILIALGVLMFMFVGYQLWGTGIQTAQAQNRLEDKFNELLASTTSVTTSTTTTTTTVLAPGDTSPSTSVPDSTLPATTTIATVPAPPVPARGEPVARLQIDRIGLDKIIVEGVSTADLKKGPGHFPETPLPGQLGQAAIAGHRTTYGAPFYDIDQVQPGDEIVVTTLAGRYVYRATDTVIVPANGYGDVIPTTNLSKATLVLVSCHPRYTARERIVVRAELVPELSSPLSVRQLVPLPDTGPDQTLPGDDIPDGSAPTGSTPTGTAPTESTPPASTPGTTPVTTPVTPADPGATGGTTGEDAFSGGWFSDSRAWPHVIAWGLVEAAIALAAYGLARRVRRLWVGIVVGILPFLFFLYFFFENVNRLLPPNL
jgi:sortase A